MFLLQLQLHVLTKIRVTLRRIQKPFRRKSTFCKFKYTSVSKGYKESQFYKLYTAIVANEPYTDQLYLQESTWFFFTSVYFDTTGSYEVQLIKNTLKQTKFEDKTVKSTKLSLVPVGLHDFQTVWRMREACKRETYVRSKSFSSESAVKNLHVGRRKIQISPPLGEQDQSNAPPQGQQRQSNSHAMPCLPPPLPA